MTTYAVDEIVEEIPGDTDNILMKIPDEIIQHNGWLPGDLIEITIEDEKLIIKKHE